MKPRITRLSVLRYLLQAQAAVVTNSAVSMSKIGRFAQAASRVRAPASYRDPKSKSKLHSTL